MPVATNVRILRRLNAVVARESWVVSAELSPRGPDALDQASESAISGNASSMDSITSVSYSTHCV
jgi:hypothetical protein